MEGLDISPEEVESVTKFLGELEAMRTTNPEMYLQAMAAMGFPDGEIPDIGDGSSVGGASTASKEDNLRTMTEAIMKMRLGQGEEQTDGIKLPKKELVRLLLFL